LSLFLTLALVATLPANDVDARVAAAARAAVQARAATAKRQLEIAIEPGAHAWPANTRVIGAIVPDPFPRARLPVVVRLDCDGLPRRAVVWATLSERRRVATYGGPYARGTVADRVVITEQIVDLVPYRGTPVDVVPAGAVLDRDVAVGSPVRAEDFGAAPVVQAGERVRLEAHTGVVALQSSAWALESGVVGDRIQVRLETPSRAVAARIVGKGQVAVDE
jgi:flagella basal body P-ring formation protein FlgA